MNNQAIKKGYKWKCKYLKMNNQAIKKGYKWKCKYNKYVLSFERLFYKMIFCIYKLQKKMFTVKIAYKYFNDKHPSQQVQEQLKYIVRKKRTLFKKNLTYLCKNRYSIEEGKQHFFSQTSKKPSIKYFGSRCFLEKKLCTLLAKKQRIEKLSLIFCAFSNQISSPFVMKILFALFKNFLFEEIVFAFITKSAINKKVKSNIMSFISENLVGIKIILK
jgi:hypothetical protein